MSKIQVFEKVRWSPGCQIVGLASTPLTQIMLNVCVCVIVVEWSIELRQFSGCWSDFSVLCLPCSSWCSLLLHTRRRLWLCIAGLQQPWCVHLYV